ncbi:hypothetical protein J2X69_004100 [Algoriphagus sp. 4150]|uniref:DUF1553 domain-containing protein n=1 Tax=Algoriphagus sp. 4150 TaxID=2817756 RepID=UPI002857551E|nr:DUF1553 domain-containing protein [Algoriphagus sp. 4150]MDR7131735.1 hypothetical protein [Algoriphagus sp. 4150]
MNNLKAAGILTLAIILAIGGVMIFGQEKEVDFSSQIKPILNKNCISCHGGVKKSGGFSVLFEEEALENTDSGHPAIIPGDPNGSELIKRLTSSDPEVRMPYERTPLSKEEIDLLKTWIKQGAKWGEHWAYKPIRSPEANEQKTTAGFSSDHNYSASSSIDLYIRKKLQEQELDFSKKEAPLKLLRRVALDITGLPPAEGLLAEYSSKKITYEQAVDQMLSSPTFGEKWATWWLDLARYADTKGYERDASRTMWPYRDWVIRAFNEDKPFDEFTIEQLAGDLLPDPTEDQLTATAFHRNTMNNDEGGTDDEEFRVAAVLDRVSTTYEVWQSTTMACVQCHSHPYDPIRHEEFYQSVAFFNNSRDEDTHDEEPRLRFYSPDRKSEIESVLAWVRENESTQAAKNRKDFLTFLEPKYPSHNAVEFTNAELIDTKWLGIQANGSAYLKKIDTQGSDQMLIQYGSGLDGSKMTIRNGGPEGEILAAFPINKTDGDIIRAVPFKPIKGFVDLFLAVENPSVKSDQNAAKFVWFAFVPMLRGKGKPGFKEVQDAWEAALNHGGTKLPIMIENPDYMTRETHVFERGNWMIPGDKVNPETPKVLNNWNQDWPNNRLGFAYWLTDKENPLTSRTLVNRVWDQLFGRGIVNSLEDMGTQSDPPSHPELMDYLAWKTMNDYGWSLKSLIREIVTSDTYKQSSAISPDLFAKDPQNKWYARGPRFRLSAEQVRDQSLAVSGLLSDKMYGPGVKPHQPEGIWQTVYNGDSWTESQGEDAHRRGVYTFLKRTSPYPSFISFDAASREVCLSRRIVTNTPLQALVTLNDPVYLEAAYYLAEDMLRENPKNPRKSITYGYKKLVLIPISDAKLEALSTLYEEALSEYTANPESLQAFFTRKDKATNPEQAAMAVVANALLNMDEFLTKP